MLVVKTWPLEQFWKNGGMFLRTHCRREDGKEHRYWSLVENHRTAEGRVVQRQVLYLGEVNDSQKQSSCRTTEAL